MTAAMPSVTANPPRGEHRIVFRHRGRTVDVFDTQDGWHFMVEGDRAPSRQLQTAGRAIEGGIRVAEAKARRDGGVSHTPKTNPKRVIDDYARKL